MDKKEFSVIASQAEAFLKEDGNSKMFNQNFEKLLEFSDNLEDEFEGSAIILFSFYTVISCLYFSIYFFMVNCFSKYTF